MKMDLDIAVSPSGSDTDQGIAVLGDVTNSMNGNLTSPIFIVGHIEIGAGHLYPVVVYITNQEVLDVNAGTDLRGGERGDVIPPALLETTRRRY